MERRYLSQVPEAEIDYYLKARKIGDVFEGEYIKARKALKLSLELSPLKYSVEDNEIGRHIYQSNGNGEDHYGAFITCGCGKETLYDLGSVGVAIELSQTGWTCDYNCINSPYPGYCRGK